MSSLAQDVAATVRDVPDFPKPGILFKDITPVLADRSLLPRVLHWIAETWADHQIEYVVGIESRGFIFGAAAAARLSAGFVPIRKAGKLPWRTVSVEYALEYGTDKVEAHEDAIPEGARVLVVDDLLATGGTAGAAVELVRRLGGEVVGCCFPIELAFLDGRSKLDVPVVSLVTYG